MADTTVALLAVLVAACLWTERRWLREWLHDRRRPRARPQRQLPPGHAHNQQAPGWEMLPRVQFTPEEQARLAAYKPRVDVEEKL